MDTLNDIRRSLMPLHLTMAQFERGGPECSRFIEKLYRELGESGQAEPDEDQSYEIARLETKVEGLEDETRALTAALAKANEMLLAAGLEPVGL